VHVRILSHAVALFARHVVVKAAASANAMIDRPSNVTHNTINGPVFGNLFMLLLRFADGHWHARDSFSFNARTALSAASSVTRVGCFLNAAIQRCAFVEVP
jgi:hypothetical protein